MVKFFAVFEWTDRDSGWYDIADAIGSRVFKTERGAISYRDKVTATSCLVTERGFVVRDAPFIKMHDCLITKQGQIVMSTPCTCPLPHVNVDPRCLYHCPDDEHVFKAGEGSYPAYLYCDICGASETDHRL